MDTILLVVFLALGVWSTLVNTAKLIGRNSIPALNFVIQAVGIVGFLVIFFDLLSR